MRLKKNRAREPILCPVVDRKILASIDRALHIAVTFNSGTRAKAGGANRGSNIATSKMARFKETLAQ